MSRRGRGRRAREEVGRQGEGQVWEKEGRGGGKDRRLYTICELNPRTV